ncbi:AAA family ATPase [Hymenobacter elongatus]|uniref:Endonuclease GajA/Old nuclease/RecF-like AAA domain-containing protein n=1 Tax=Hymenobacter elongatus TaxID=877208 RepID=A0A4Z0PP55_9BACT|nr:AAA family ATPase [Hymenobacter elongatus]TGE19274.1 hypothetical protein E5J99_03270 [Hymenobacter elongatus]
MSERLIIRNFAGLDNIDIELGRINIFIGPQASGKSVCAKCLYLFKSFIPTLFASIKSGQSKINFEDSYLIRFREYFPNLWRNDKDFILRYEAANIFVQIESKDRKFEFTYSDIFITTAENARKEVEAFNTKSIRFPHSQDIFERLAWEPQALYNLRASFHYSNGNELEPLQRYVIAGRSFFTALKGSVLTFLANTPSSAIDPLLKDFIQQYEIARRYQLIDGASDKKSFYNLTQQIIKGKLALNGDEDYVVNNDGRRVPLANSSSGQQEVFPLLLMLLALIPEEEDRYGPIDDESQVLYIEEPEAHLFPESQQAIAYLMAAIYKQSPWHLQYIITTHSPYFLTSFNNLIYAHQLAERLHDQPTELKKLYKIVPKSQQVPLSDFRVYGLENGKAISLIDYELGLISASLLDSASDVTADQFGDLMALDPTTKP